LAVSSIVPPSRASDHGKVLLWDIHFELLDAVNELSESQRAEVSLVLENLISKARIKKFRLGELIEFEQLNQGS